MRSVEAWGGFELTWRLADCLDKCMSELWHDLCKVSGRTPGCEGLEAAHDGLG